MGGGMMPFDAKEKNVTFFVVPSLFCLLERNKKEKCNSKNVEGVGEGLRQNK